MAPREQPSSSAGQSGPPAHKQIETHNKYATESKVQRDLHNFLPQVYSHDGLFAPVLRFMYEWSEVTHILAA